MTKTKAALCRHSDWHLVVLCALALFILWPRLAEVRVIRDVLGLTPFHSVTVEAVSPGAHGVMISGTMVKARCEWRGMSAYASDAEGRRERVQIDLQPEDAIRPPGNRPPGAQEWGPWEIYAPPTIGQPIRWEVHAHHRCPVIAVNQINLFASGDWP